MNLSGKEGNTDIQLLTRPGIEPGTFGFGGRDPTTAPTPPLNLDKKHNEPQKHRAMCSKTVEQSAVSTLCGWCLLARTHPGGLQCLLFSRGSQARLSPASGSFRLCA